MDRPGVLEVTEALELGPGISRLVLDGSLDFEPGQFAMVWVPGVDEIPLSLVGGSPLELLVQAVGDATEAVRSLSAGDRLGIRGPYGSGFEVRGGRSLLLGGGIGVAPLIPLARRVAEFDAAVGAGTADLLVGVEELGAEVATDDGSAGFHGLVTELVEEKDFDKYDEVYCCGPEVMMRAVLDMCLEGGVEGQFSLERYMKCGVGLCGSCCMDPGGERVCVEGPVFSSGGLVGTEFGSYVRDGAGRRHRL